MKANQSFKRSAVVLAAALVAACGGGGGGGGASSGTNTPAVTTLSGTAAVGYPIVGASVSVRCAAGSPPVATITDSQGAWSIDVANQTLPCAASLTGGTANGVANSTSYHSIATARGVVNITPITDLLVANLIQSATPTTWFAGLAGTPGTLSGVTSSQVDASLQRLRDAMPLVQPLSNLNPITDSFTPTAGQAMDDMLEALSQARIETGVTHATQLGVVAVAGAITIDESFNSSVVWKFRGTTSGGNSNHASSIVTTAAPTPTYANGSEEAAAFNLLNAERARCGFGTLVQSTQIDAAAQSHADWGLSNWVWSHYENGTNYPLSYTGYSANDRVIAQGYTDLGNAGEVMAGDIGTSAKAGLGSQHMRRLLSAPFHLRILTAGYRDVGFSIRSNSDAGSTNAAVYEQVNLAYKQSTSKQLQSSSSILTYPCEGTTGVNYRLTSETPNPVPGRDLAANPLGHPIVVRVREGNALSISDVSLRNLATNSLVTLRSSATTKANDTSGRFMSNEAYVIPDSPLIQNTSYRVTMTGTNSNVPFTKTFVFSTGSGG